MSPERQLNAPQDVRIQAVSHAASRRSAGSRRTSAKVYSSIVRVSRTAPKASFPATEVVTTSTRRRIQSAWRRTSSSKYVKCRVKRTVSRKDARS